MYVLPYEPSSISVKHLPYALVLTMSTRPLILSACRLAMVTAAKAVAFALTPGLEPIKAVTMWSGRRGLGPSVEFISGWRWEGRGGVAAERQRGGVGGTALLEHQRWG